MGYRWCRGEGHRARHVPGQRKPRQGCEGSQEQPKRYRERYNGADNVNFTVFGTTPMSPLRVVPDGVSGTHSDPVWNWTILLQLLSLVLIRNVLRADIAKVVHHAKAPC